MLEGQVRMYRHWHCSLSFYFAGVEQIRLFCVEMRYMINYYAMLLGSSFLYVAVLTKIHTVNNYSMLSVL